MTSTATIPVIRLSRAEEMKRLRRATRLRDRRRKVDAFQYRYRHVVNVCAGGFLATVVVTVAKLTGLV